MHLLSNTPNMKKLTSRLFRVATLLLVLLVMACTVVQENSSENEPLATSLRSPSESLSVNSIGSTSASPFSRSIRDAISNNTHYINLLEFGDDALLARIHLIRNAQRSINLQTFIWELDASGRLLIYELIEAAKRGVEVKVIVDFFSVTKEAEAYAFLSTVSSNMEVKVYNPLVSNIENSQLILTINMTTNFRGVNQRMHNKILVVDDQVGITGGRNHGDEYFDRGVQRNFRDRDVLIIGPVVHAMSASFWDYWQHPLSVNTDEMSDVKSLIDSGEFRVFDTLESFNIGDSFDEIDSCSASNDCIQTRFIDNQYPVERIEFIADQPGKTEEIGELRATQTTVALASMLQSAQTSVIMQTPYLVVGRQGGRFFSDLIKTNPDLEILVSSNSLAAADHVHAYAYSYKNKKRYLKNYHWQIFEFKPTPHDADRIIQPFSADARSDTYYVCIHAKSYVVDGEKVWIGSYNLDPRSANLNTEVGVIIYDERVALAVEEAIRRDMSDANSWAVAKRQERPLRSVFSGLIGTIIQFVPFVNIWPFTYSGSYELSDGMAPVPMSDDNFYDHYRYVGPFPETSGTTKEIEARLIKGFFGVFQGLI